MAVKGIEMELGDGVKYVIAPLTLGSLEDLQERIEQVDGGLDRDAMKTMVDVAHASLKRNYPALTRDEVRDLLDVANMTDVFEAALDVSGLKRKAIAAGEAQPVRPRRKAASPA